VLLRSTQYLVDLILTKLVEFYKKNNSFPNDFLSWNLSQPCIAFLISDYLITTRMLIATTNLLVLFIAGFYRILYGEDPNAYTGADEQEEEEDKGFVDPAFEIDLDAGGDDDDDD